MSTPGPAEPVHFEGRCEAHCPHLVRSEETGGHVPACRKMGAFLEYYDGWLALCTALPEYAEEQRRLAPWAVEEVSAPR